MRKMSSIEIMEMAIRRRELLTYLYRNRRRKNATEIKINGIKDRVITTPPVTGTESSPPSSIEEKRKTQSRSLAQIKSPESDFGSSPSEER